MGHHRITRHHDGAYLFGTSTEPSDEGIYGLYRQSLHGTQSLRIVAVVDPREYVLAVNHLLVIISCRCDHVPGIQVHEVCHHCCCTEIHGKTKVLMTLISTLHIGELTSMIDA